jgi:histidinol-phosphate phosphatase family protein
MRRCAFLDRDGVINVKPTEGEYVRSWSEFRLIPETVDWIRLFNALDLLVIVVTNQRGVARGLMPQRELDAIHSKMVDELAQRGARVDDVFCCPHEKDACDCRKPKPGLVLAAQEKWRIDLARSIMIGDSQSDEELAARCGMRFVGVAEGRLLDPLAVWS